MKTVSLSIALLAAGLTMVASPTMAGGSSSWKYGDYSFRTEFKDEYRDGPCQVKMEAKRREYTREVKCKDGYGAYWRGEWKEEYRDGRCLIKRDVKRDEFKEEIKCQ